MNSDKVRFITETKVPLEAVDRLVLDKIKAQKSVRVPTRRLRSSFGFLYSDDFGRCQGVCYSSPNFKVGALAHNHPEQDPYCLLRGEGENKEDIEDPRKIFDDLSRVLAVHIRHQNDYSYPEVYIEGALKGIGIEKIIHLAIRTTGSHFWRDIAHDVTRGLVYVFPRELNYGICLDLKKCFNAGGGKCQQQ